MRTRRTLLVVVAAISCLVIVWLTTAIHGGETGRTYEIHPQVAVPYGYTPNTDTYRLIDLIEYLTDQNQQIAQDHLANMSAQLNALAEKLDAVDTKLTNLSRRMTRIEKALGIKGPKASTDQKKDKES
jgi:predicted transcriptional regulator